jgi:SRSO17 transposase
LFALFKRNNRQVLRSPCCNAFLCGTQARVDDIEVSRLRAGLDDAFALVAGRFFRREVRARSCLGGMLSGLERKASWSLAEHAGEARPDGMQRLFTAARWDADGVRDDLRAYVAAALGEPDAS